MKEERRWIAVLILVACCLAAGEGRADQAVLRMATTTSTDNTGLLDVLGLRFKADTGIELQWVAVGTGKALELGKNCDVDVLFVHAPEAERKFVQDGYGIDRREVMYNDFVLIGPAADPAGVKGQGVIEALKTVAERGAVFVSRGDASGTHKKELSLWEKAGVSGIDKETWYVQTGQGMLPTINVAAERQGYTLTDRGTFIKYEDQHKGNPPLVIMVEGDPGLFNQYSVISVNPERCPKVRRDLAAAFSDWVVSAPIQALIGDFKLMGKPLFVPNAKP